jgi:hypothetical protein
MTATRAQMKAQMIKVNNIAIKNRIESTKLCEMCNEYYGEENYSDNDKDEIIDCLDYGQGTISFEDFDTIMREINNTE